MGTALQNSRYMAPSLDIKTLRDNLLLRSLTSPHVERYILSLSHSQKIEYFNSNHQHLLQELFTIDKVIQINFQTMQFQNTLQSTKEGARYCESIDCHKSLQTIAASLTFAGFLKTLSFLYHQMTPDLVQLR